MFRITTSLRAGLAAGVLGLTLLATACGGQSGSAGTSGKSLEGKTIALVGYGKSNPWGAYYNKVFGDRLASTGVKINDLTTMDPGTQVQKFNQAVAQKPDLIVTAMLDTKAMVVPIKKAKTAGIPVLAVDGRPDPAVAGDVMAVLSDNEKLGEFAAQNIIEGLKAQGRTSGSIIVLTGTKSMLVTQDRMKGFNRVMATAPQYKVVDEQDANWDPQLSGTIARQLLAKHGKDGVQAAYGMADYMALPIIQAATQAGFPVGGKKGLVVTGSNCFKAGIDAIKAGRLYGTATEDPGTIAAQTADYVVRFLTDKNPPRQEIVKEERITAANVAQQAEKCSHA
ncbi:sugar ABC transporter substrate-binding protein [Actinomadura madurae]|uniref:ABC-type sugar transport system, substrate-binding protein, contains N-terminal xre family HTH domain n=1 Tax=Actinomadura madurae TaxID=1993 RepID=A0A1I5WM86_9ACTN|nr:sugar ABC transporter substrate-binding protein [Actinomadura madurae]SFQ20809.1 ABC-type sugar transport system, substrate-binding protein, contains N-terminal xre family HTH domain [Actinomadura madurae]